MLQIFVKSGNLLVLLLPSMRYDYKDYNDNEYNPYTSR